MGLSILGSGDKSSRGECDQPAYLTAADELCRLSIDGLIFKVFCHPPNETSWPILQNVFSYEFDPRCDVFRDRFLAQNVLSSGKCFQYNLWLLDDRKNDDNGVDVGPCQEHINGTPWISIVVDGRICSDWTQSGFRECGQVFRTFFGAGIDGSYGDLITEGGQAGDVRFGYEGMR